MSFQELGKFLSRDLHPAGNDPCESARSFAEAIARALRRAFGDSKEGRRLVREWTGASRKSVDNWFAGVCVPSMLNLVKIARHSDQVMLELLLLTHRPELAVNLEYADMLETVEDSLARMRRLRELGGGEESGDPLPAE